MLLAVGSSRSNGPNVTVSTLSQANTGLTEHDYIGLSEVSSSSSDHTQEQCNVESLAEAKPNLGLTLSYEKENSANTNAAITSKGFVVRMSIRGVVLTMRASFIEEDSNSGLLPRRDCGKVEGF